MKRSTLSLLFLLMCCLAQAQSTAPDVVGSAGEHFSSSTAQVAWTAGEAAIATLSGGNNHLTEGFHQTKLSITALDPMQEAEVKVYPNPAHEFVFVEAESGLSAARLRLVDMHGRILQDNILLESGTRQRIDLSQVAVGQYILSVRPDDGRPSQAFKILKTH